VAEGAGEGDPLDGDVGVAGARHRDEERQEVVLGVGAGGGGLRDRPHHLEAERVEVDALERREEALAHGGDVVALDGGDHLVGGAAARARRSRR
jgi:hypothetical protein